jgi:hypothetical protein
LVEVPALLRQLSADPATVLASAGLDAGALAHVNNTVPYISAMQVLHHGAQQTSCAHFGLLAGQR